MEKIDKQEYDDILSLIKREVVPAMGCTEPIAVSLATAKASEVLGTVPERVTVYLSANILKNAMGVGIPGTGMIGLPIAIALGAICGKPEYGLEVIKDSTPADIERGRQMIADKRITVKLKQGSCDKLHAEAVCEADGHTATAVISGNHTNFIYIALDDHAILDKHSGTAGSDSTGRLNLTMSKVYEFASTAAPDDITFIMDAAKLNMKASEEGLSGNYGHRFGKLLISDKKNYLMGNSLYSKVLSYTSAACDARMGGAMVPVMSNSGSGNQGIAATVPVVVYARETGKSQEQLLRALTLSHLTAIYIKQSLGRLSALCGCVVAATGSACGLTYLMGGKYCNVAYTVKNMIANITGMICDGAKPSCSLKLSTGVSTAMLSSLLAMEGECVSSVEGIVDDDVDKTIKNLTKIGAVGMNETDKIVLDIMTDK